MDIIWHCEDIMKRIVLFCDLRPSAQFNGIAGCSWMLSDIWFWKRRAAMETFVAKEIDDYFQEYWRAQVNGLIYLLQKLVGAMLVQRNRRRTTRTRKEGTTTTTTTTTTTLRTTITNLIKLPYVAGRQL